MQDITAELGERMAALQQRLDQLNRNRTALDEEQRTIEHQLQALRTVLDLEANRQGGSGVASSRVSGPAAWLGVNLREAVRRLSEQYPSWEFEQIRNRLIKDGFDFKGKRPGNAVHMALIGLRRKQGGGDEDEA